MTKPAKRNIKIPKLSIGDVIYLEWDDAWKDSGTWKSIKDALIPTPAPMISAGIYLGENPNGDLIISTSIEANGDDRWVSTVNGRPKEMITKIEILKRRVLK